MKTLVTVLAAVVGVGATVSEAMLIANAWASLNTGNFLLPFVIAVVGLLALFRILSIVEGWFKWLE